MTEKLPLLVRFARIVASDDRNAESKVQDSVPAVPGIVATGTIVTRQAQDTSADESGDR